MDTKNWYIEYAVGGVQNRMNICPADKFSSIAQQHMGKEMYRSMFLYEHSINEHVNKTGSVSDFNGVQAIDKLILDIDLSGEKSGEKTRLKVVKLLNKMKMMNIPDSYLQVWFSGSGFHIHIPDIYGFEPSNNVAKIVRATMQRDFGDYIDLIYDGRRLIRTGYSFNKKTNCYKTPLSLQEIEQWSYDNIKDSAKSIRSNYNPPKFDVETDYTLEEFKPMDISRKNAKQHRQVFEKRQGTTSRYITCAQHLYNAGEVKGKRHHNLLRIVSIWIKKYGFDKVACDNLARAYMSRMENPLPAEEVSRIVADAYKAGGYNYGCSDEVLSEYCDSKCTLFRFKNLDEETKVINAEDMINTLANYYNTDFSDKSFDLKTVFPFMHESYLFKGGELAMLIGDTKLGKTALWQYVVANIPKVKTLFLSLEVDDITIIRRFFQIVLKMEKEPVINALRNHDVAVTEQAKSKMSHIDIITAANAPDITEYRELISDYNPKIIVVDTIDRVKAKYAKSEPLQRQEYVINQLKDIAMEQEIIMLGVSHISKGASNQLSEGQRLTIHSAKGSSDIEQKADKVISFEGDRNMGTKRRIEALGSRDETGFDITVNFDWRTFNFTKRT